MTIKKIGTIDLTNPIWWLEYNQTPNIQSEVSATITGGVIVWEQSYESTAKNISLSSKDNGWQTIAVKDSLKDLVSNSIGTTTTITTTDDEEIQVRFRHEVEGGAITFERVVESKLSNFYTCNIYLARI